MLKRLYNKVLTIPSASCSKQSFSQNGEDIIIKTIFDIRGIDKITYLDIGANNPIIINNTYLFYINGSRGINVEANPSLIDRFNKIRPKDINLNLGISDSDNMLDFYVMSNDKVSTFSHEEYQNNLKMGLLLKQKVKVKVTTIQNIITEHFDSCFPDLLNIDVEGLEFEVLKSMSFESNNTPKVICLESVEHSSKGNGNKRNDIIQFVINRNYHLYADTHFNSIFVRNDFWNF